MTRCMNRGFERKKRPFPVLPLLTITTILLLGFGLRMWNIDAYSFWSDEGLTPLRSGYSVPDILRNVILIQGHVTKDTHPAFFYLVIHFTRQLFGDTDFAFRYPSVLFSMLLMALLYRFGRKLASPQLGLIIAFLMAINPLHVWYANEARMYAIYSFLAAAASYMLWRAISITNDTKRESILDLFRQRQLPRFYRYLIGYGVLAGLALYTNYTAVFLIAAQGLIWAWLFWKRGHLRDILVPALLVIVIALPNVGDTIPRLFNGTEANFFFVPPIIMIQDVFRFFSLGLTFNYGQITLGFFTIVGATLTLIGTIAAKDNMTRIFLLSYLFAVVFGLMAGQFIKPMYQGARHIMVGSPAFVIVAGMGLYWIWGQTRRKNAVPVPLKFLLAGALTIAALFGPLHSLVNYYSNPTFAKDDFRGLIQFVERSAGPNDAIVYNNAVLLPLHEHYQTRNDTQLTASPTYPFQAQAVSASELTTIASQVDHIWFITDPPTDKRDAAGAAKVWLDENLGASEIFPFQARTTALNVILYRALSPYQDTLPETAVSLNQSWADNVTLSGLELFPPAEASNLMNVDLYWQGPIDIANIDLSLLRFSILGPDGSEWAVINHSLLSEDSDLNTQTNQLIRTSYLIELPEGLPPASYQLVVQGLDANSNPLPNHQTSANLILSSSIVAQFDQPLLQYENGIQLNEVELADNLVKPGHNLPLTLFWSLPQEVTEPDEFAYELIVIDENGDQLRNDAGILGPDWLANWPINTAVRENSSIYIRPESEPGEYRLQIQLREGETLLNRATRIPFSRSNQPQTIGEFTIEPWPLNTEMPSFETAVSAQFDPFITLPGYDLEQTDSQIDLTLYWQTDQQPDNNYLLFIHIVDEASEIVQQVDQVPVTGLRPTGGWRPDEVLIDNYSIPLSSELTAGTYEIRLGFFHPESATRLPVLVDDVQQPNNQLVLTTITIP